MIPPPRRGLEIDDSPEALQHAQELGRAHRAAFFEAAVEHPYFLRPWNTFNISLLDDPEFNLRAALSGIATDPTKNIRTRTEAALAMIRLDAVEGISSLESVCNSVSKPADFEYLGSRTLEAARYGSLVKLTAHLLGRPWLRDWSERWLALLPFGEASALAQLVGSNKAPPPPDIRGDSPAPKDLVTVLERSIGHHPTREAFQALAHSIAADPDDTGPWRVLAAGGRHLRTVAPDLVADLLNSAQKYLAAPNSYYSRNYTVVIDAVVAIATDPVAELMSSRPGPNQRDSGRELAKRISSLQYERQLTALFDRLLEDPTTLSQLFIESRRLVRQPVDMALLTHLAGFEARLDDLDDRAALVTLFLDVADSAALPLANRFLPRLPDAMKDRLSQLNEAAAFAAKMANRACQLGLIPGSRHDVWKSFSFDELQKLASNPVKLFIRAGHADCLSADSDTNPPRYDDTLLDLAALSDGEVRPTDLSQSFPSDSNSPLIKGSFITVQFVMGSRVYRFFPRYNRDWMEFGHLTSAINAALADAGCQRRFHLINPYSDLADLVFAETTALRQFATEFRMGDILDPDDAATIAIGYHDKIWHQLNNPTRSPKA